jgi:hypothetical protein
MGRFLADHESHNEAAQPPVVEQRTGERHRTVLQVAKLTTAHGEELCILRNVSSGGLRADVYCDLTRGDAVEFELRTGRRVAGHVAWTKDNAIGVAFDHQVPILDYLAHEAVEGIGHRIRSPRIQIGAAGVISVAADESDIEIVDASQRGMRIRTDLDLPIGSDCRISAAGLDPRGGLVRWCRDGEIGLELKQPMTFAEFAQWRRRSGSRARPH